MIHRLRNDHDTRQKLIDKRLNLSRYLRLSLLGIVIAICVHYWYACATKSNEDMEKNTGVTKMRATTQFPEATKRERIAVNTKELQAMLGCGRKTAVDIGEQAGAKIQIGRRVLWNPIIVKEYIAQISL